MVGDGHARPAVRVETAAVGSTAAVSERGVFPGKRAQNQALWWAENGSGWERIVNADLAGGSTAAANGARKQQAFGGRKQRIVGQLDRPVPTNSRRNDEPARRSRGMGSQNIAGSAARLRVGLIETDSGLHGPLNLTAKLARDTNTAS